MKKKSTKKVPKKVPNTPYVPRQVILASVIYCSECMQVPTDALCSNCSLPVCPRCIDQHRKDHIEASVKSSYAPGGVSRGARARGFISIPSSGIRRIADRFDLGQEKYPDAPDGTPNWKICLRNEASALAFMRESFNHAFEHMLNCAYGTPDDNLAAVGWFVVVACEVEQYFGKPWTELKHDA